MSDVSLLTRRRVAAAPGGPPFGDTWVRSPQANTNIVGTMPTGPIQGFGPWTYLPISATGEEDQNNFKSGDISGTPSVRYDKATEVETTIEYWLAAEMAASGPVDMGVRFTNVRHLTIAGVGPGLRVPHTLISPVTADGIFCNPVGTGSGTMRVTTSQFTNPGIEVACTTNDRIEMRVSGTAPSILVEIENLTAGGSDSGTLTNARWQVGYWAGWIAATRADKIAWLGDCEWFLL